MSFIDCLHMTNPARSARTSPRLPAAGREQAGSVQVKADARTEALAVVRVLEWLREAGIDRVQLVTQARGG